MGPLTFFVVCEAVADFRTATALTERVICEQAPWIEGQTQHFFEWRGPDDQSTCWLWREIGKKARAAGVKARGKFDDEPGSPDAKVARRALIYFRDRMLDGQPLDAVLLIRDDDGDPDHRVGLEQARDAVAELADRVVIGVAHLKRECWVLAGFLPNDERETELMGELRRQLSFDPCLESHRLTAKHDHEVRSAKRVLKMLTQGQFEREQACWAATKLATLRERGEASGLRAFLDEIAERLVPLFGGQRAG